MARIRTIKPDFWTSDKVVNCSMTARLLFIGLWNFCDDGGVHPDVPKTIKMRVFPGDDDINSTTIRQLLDELSAKGLLHLYEISGEGYLHVKGWEDHQKIEKPNYRYPRPQGAVPQAKVSDGGKPPKSGKNSTTSRRTVAERSESDSRPLDDHSPPEGRKEGREGDRELPLPPSQDAARASPVEPEAAAGLGKWVLEYFASPNLVHAGPVRDWVRAGASPALIRGVVVQVTEQQRVKAPDWAPRSLNYFTEAVMRAMRDGVHPPDPEAKHDPERDRWLGRMGSWSRGMWLEDWGPPPGERGCEMPQRLQDEAMAMKSKKAGA